MSKWIAKSIEIDTSTSTSTSIDFDLDLDLEIEITHVQWKGKPFPTLPQGQGGGGPGGVWGGVPPSCLLNFGSFQLPSSKAPQNVGFCLFSARRAQGAPFHDFNAPDSTRFQKTRVFSIFVFCFGDALVF